MRADRAKQLLKNGVYRAIGETVSGAGGLDGEAERTLRVLMYHKVNDLQPNATTVPTAVFARADGAARRARLRAGLARRRCATTTWTARRFRPVPSSSPSTTATATTSRMRCRSSRVTAIPAVIFVPIGFLDGDRPLPHEEALRALGVRNPTVDWDELAALDAGGIRVESHGIGHRPVSELEPADAAREIALSKLRLEARLGRPVEAYAFVKGSLADYRARAREPRAAGRVHARLHSVSGANGPTSDPLPAPPLQRRAVPAADVRARARRRLRPHLGEGHGARHVRPPRLQQGARHGDTMSFTHCSVHAGVAAVARRAPRPRRAPLSSRTRSSPGGSTAIREAGESCRSPSTMGRSWGSLR